MGTLARGMVAPVEVPGMTPLAHEIGPRVPQLTDSAYVVAAWRRTRWPDWSGLGGRIRPERVAGFNRNEWPDCSGIRSTASLDLVVECKSSPGKPWVVFASPTKSNDWFLPSMLAVGRVSEVMLTASMGTPDPLHFLRPQDWVGYTIAKSHSSSKDGDSSGAYGALRSVMSAAEAFASKCEAKLSENPSWPPVIELTLPVLVIGAPLYLYSTDANKEEHLSAVPFAKVVAPQREFEARCLLTVVTEDHFGSWLEGIAEWADPLLEDLAARAIGIRKLVEDHRRADEVVSGESSHGA